MSNWLVYMLLCPPKGNRTVSTIYTGITNNFPNRFKAHLEGKGAKYTRANPPSHGSIIESSLSRSQALKREYYYKSLSSYNKRIILLANLSR